MFLERLDRRRVEARWRDLPVSRDREAHEFSVTVRRDDLDLTATAAVRVGGGA